jgi:hypothetical protein
MLYCPKRFWRMNVSGPIADSISAMSSLVARRTNGPASIGQNQKCQNTKQTAVDETNKMELGAFLAVERGKQLRKKFRKQFGKTGFQSLNSPFLCDINDWLLINEKIK